MWVAAATIASGLAALVAVVVAAVAYKQQSKAAEANASLALLDRRLDVVERVLAALVRFWNDPKDRKEVEEELLRLALLCDYLFRPGPTGVVRQMIRTMGRMERLVTIHLVSGTPWPPPAVLDALNIQLVQFRTEVDAQMATLRQSLPAVVDQPTKSPSKG